jgi:dimethylaniline monooxygenase (N-oxide forming)
VTEAATHPSSKDIGDYLVSYAIHFDLLRHIRFSTKVAKAERDDATGQWIVHTEVSSADGASETQKHTFDRLVVATGIFQTRKMVDIQGIEKFAGDFVHSREFKDPHQYAGKNVMVIGIGATGADTTSFLKKVGAANIYLSHRSQTYLVGIMSFPQLLFCMGINTDS